MFRFSKPEHNEQATVIQWAELQYNIYPELYWLYAIPNGFPRGKPFVTKSGKKLPPLAAVYMKEEGLKSGVPDLCLPVARRGCHSLYIEMKRDDQKLTPNQNVWQDGLRENGNCVRTCYSADEAIKVLKWYLEAL